jgi:hypothetical protein
VAGENGEIAEAIEQLRSEQADLDLPVVVHGEDEGCWPLTAVQEGSDDQQQSGPENARAPVIATGALSFADLLPDILPGLFD